MADTDGHWEVFCSWETPHAPVTRCYTREAADALARRLNATWPNRYKVREAADG